MEKQEKTEIDTSITVGCDKKDILIFFDTDYIFRQKNYNFKLLPLIAVFRIRKSSDGSFYTTINQITEDCGMNASSNKQTNQLIIRSLLLDLEKNNYISFDKDISKIRVTNIFKIILLKPILRKNSDKFTMISQFDYEKLLYINSNLNSKFENIFTVYLYILSRMYYKAGSDKRNLCYPGVNLICNATKLSSKTVKNIINTLLEYNMIYKSERLYYFEKRTNQYRCCRTVFGSEPFSTDKAIKALLAYYDDTETIYTLSDLKKKHIEINETSEGIL